MSEADTEPQSEERLSPAPPELPPALESDATSGQPEPPVRSEESRPFFRCPDRMAARLVLLATVVAYLIVWGHGNWEMLTDPRLQTDDARTTLFPFHRYGPADSLHDDPIASEMLALVPWAVRLIYMGLVPVFDLFVAAKLVQAMALAILVWACVELGKSSRVGWGGAALLLFGVLHDGFAVGRIAGGLPRAFGFPCFALWLAGVMTEKVRLRGISACLAAATYPSVMNMILAAEGIYCLRGVARSRVQVLWRRLKIYGVVVGACLLLALPSIVGGEDRGPIHNLAQAEREPAFGKTGRLWLLPFEKPSDALGHALLDPFRQRGGAPWPALRERITKEADLVAALLVIGLLLFPLTGTSPRPAAALSFGVGAVILYAASRWLAFRLYSPERYYSFGMRMLACALFVACLSQWYARFPRRKRTVLREFSAASGLLLVWFLCGSGVVKKAGMELDQSKNEKMYAFIRTLPKDIRFATHILDGDGIPLYGARMNMGAFETLQPWFTGSWAKQKARALATLDVLYATEPAKVLSYAKANGVTHFLINRGRYGDGLRTSVGSFEPFSSYAKELVRGHASEDFVFHDPPKESVVYREGRLSIVSVRELERALGD